MSYLTFCIDRFSYLLIKQRMNTNFMEDFAKIREQCEEKPTFVIAVVVALLTSPTSKH